MDLYGGLKMTLRFKCDDLGVSEDELKLLLTLSKEEIQDIIKKLGGTTTSSDTSYQKVNKDSIEYNRKLYSMLSNKMCIGFFYMLLTRNYCYYNDLFRAKSVNWTGYISKIKKLGLIKHTFLSMNAKYYYKSKTGFTDYNISRMKLYNLSSKGEDFFTDDMKNYIIDNVDTDFIVAIEEQKEEYEFLMNAIGMEEDLPLKIKNYLTMKNKKSFNKKTMQKMKQNIIKNKDLMVYVDRYSIIL